MILSIQISLVTPCFKPLIEPALDPFPLLNGHVHARMRGAAWHRGDFLVAAHRNAHHAVRGKALLDHFVFEERMK